MLNVSRPRATTSARRDESHRLGRSRHHAAQQQLIKNGWKANEEPRSAATVNGSSICTIRLNARRAHGIQAHQGTMLLSLHRPAPWAIAVIRRQRGFIG